MLAAKNTGCALEFLLGEAPSRAEIESSNSVSSSTGLCECSPKKTRRKQENTSCT